MLKNIWSEPKPVVNHKAESVVSASMDCILEAVRKVDSIIYSELCLSILKFDYGLKK